jgi:hypothetical protein
MALLMNTNGLVKGLPSSVYFIFPGKRSSPRGVYAALLIRQQEIRQQEAK